MGVQGRNSKSYGDGMTFEEIGRELKVTPQRAYFIYLNAIRKLRAANHHHAIEKWAELVREHRKALNGETTI